MKKQISIVLCLLVLVAVLLTGCSKEVAVDTSGLQNITFTGEAVATTKETYTATLTPLNTMRCPRPLLSHQTAPRWPQAIPLIPPPAP